MISRRSFLKLSGLAAVATGAGFGTGSILADGESRRFAMHAFVPDDDRLVRDMLHMFAAELPSGYGMPVIDADTHWSGVIRSALRRNTLSMGSDHGSGQVRVRMQPLGDPIRGDILLTDDRKRIYDPKGDFTTALQTLRSSLKAGEARYMISAEYMETAMLSSLFSSGSVLVVENDRGIIDRITLSGRNRRLDVTGAQGRTGVTITDAGVHVHEASCRHGLCRNAGVASRPGDVIACAPNRVLLRIERA
ncbi:MAG: NusG domain II-containing protein [Bacteroidetes bacterium]|nr:NusG domain II-containing protein [Bacteroidota bacterium]